MMMMMMNVVDDDDDDDDECCFKSNLCKIRSSQQTRATKQML